MLSGVYIGMNNEPDYDLVSTGDFINPIAKTFRLKDSQKTITYIQDLYIIVNDIEIEWCKIEVSGQMTTIRVRLSWNGDSWFKFIEKNETISAIGTTQIIPFKIKIYCDDFLEYYKLTGENIFRNFKLKLLFV